MSEICFVIFSTADWHAPYWTNKQHMAVQFERFGYHVLYVETPGIRSPKISDGRDLRRLMRRLLQGIFAPIWKATDKISVCSPLAWPWFAGHPVTKWLNQLIVRKLVRLHLSKLKNNRTIIWTYHPYCPHMPDADLTVYHCVDDLSTIPGVDAGSFNMNEMALLRSADLVFVTSSQLANKCREICQSVHEYRNVVDLEHFVRSFGDMEEPEDLAEIPHPRIAYVGVLSDFKIDIGLIEHVVENEPSWHWVFIGEEREGQSDSRLARLKTADNVHFLGHKPYSDLPRYLKYMDVGTLPTLINAYTRAMSPMKLHEYVASGLRVVSTPLEVGENLGSAVALCATPEEFVNGVMAQLTAGRMDQAEAVASVGDRTWTFRTQKMLDLVHSRIDQQ